MAGRLQSFGCSFFFGTDLGDENTGVREEGATTTNRAASKKTWPAIIAKTLGLRYECYAWPGTGNDQIAKSIIANVKEGCVVLINWTYIDRFDYINSLLTLPDGSTDQELSICPGDNNSTARVYYDNFHSERQDKWRSLQSIYSTHQYLKSKNIKFISTYMDNLLFDTKFHSPPYIRNLQNQLKNELHRFARYNFVEWANKRNFEISDNNHPLHEAHERAAEIWMMKVNDLYEEYTINDTKDDDK